MYDVRNGKLNNCLFIAALQEGKKDIKYYYKSQEASFVFSCFILLNARVRGGAAKFGFISITYHKYILGVHKYILRLEISTFDRENR